MNNKEELLHSNVPVSRDALYELVWSEPMLNVAARFGVSSSYMARVCTALNVPRPGGGYWGKAAVGRAPPSPALPPARPGDRLTWKKGETVSIAVQVLRSSRGVRPRVPRRPQGNEQPSYTIRSEKVADHHLIEDTKGHFDKGRFSRGLGYLKPDKKTLVDVIVTRATLDRALSFANMFFQALESRQHRVLFGRDREETQRLTPDVLEKPAGPLDGYSHLWAPYYPTVVYVGTVPFGLSVVEMAEEVQARYVDGKYIRDSEYKPPKRRYGFDSTWTTKHQFPTGRLRLQVYSAFRGTDWKRHWDEKHQPLDSLVETIVAALEKSVGAVSQLIDDSKRKSEQRHREWEAQREEWRREEEQQKIAEAHKQSHEELRRIMSAWVEAREREAFFADVERRVADDAGDRREQLLGRLRRGRMLLSTADVLELFTRWRSPEERLQRESQ